jgi:hypothetical protein
MQGGNENHFSEIITSTIKLKNLLKKKLDSSKKCGFWFISDAKLVIEKVLV